MYKMTSLVLTAAVAVVLLAAPAMAEGPRILFLSKSSGFEHSVIKVSDGNPSCVDTVLTIVAQDMGATITCTKDASLINADNLKNYDLVIFYTTGDLTEPGTDKNPPMSKTGVAELLDWVKQGGGVMGYHAATDTFRTPDPKPSPYVDMMGGEFKAHGKQFAGIVRTVDKAHPTMAHMPQDWKNWDEWYMCQKLNTAKMHVLALLDPADERQKQEIYNVPSYPIIWCLQYGKGRVYYNGLGHVPAVWLDPAFRKTIVDSINWSTGKGPAENEPNYDKVVPKTVAESMPK